ncbi:GntR family transcriptional regulator [Spiractinospora alimapuensis]|uniref:GntR family transcriptional regulator n=1 Tax=Spiractinospora alimapuensis TaxID=2820884 RepID=UPI001F394B78|nr:GntR family transcriptional regulator [Spiractinospora alimapuensis]
MSSSRSTDDAVAARVERPVPLRERVYDALLELITSRRLPPGRHLVESDLAEQLGVSRQPVRETLQRLSMEGWVDLRPGYGAFVHQPTASEADQLFAVRGLLETESARLAAHSADSAGVAHLRAVLERGASAARDGDVDASVAANADLHRLLTELSGNTVLAELAAQVARRVRWYHGSVAELRGTAAWTEHAEIIDAVERGEADRAADLMRAHTDRTRRMYLDQVAHDDVEATPRR